MATTTKTRPAADWSLAPRGAVSGAVTGFLGVAALAATAHAIEVGPVWTAAGTVVSAVGSILHSADLGAHTPTLLYRLCCVLGGGGWVAYAAATTPWDQTTMLGLGLGVLTAAVLAPFFRIKQPTATAGRKGGAVVLRKTTQLAREWEERILKVTRIQVEITDVHYWESKAGYTLTGLLPLDGSTRQQLGSNVNTAGMAAAARLKDGCGIEVDKGPHRGSFTMRVMTVNRLAEDVAWHGDLSARDIHVDAVLGEHRDSTPMGVPLREESVVVIGQKGSGKTTLLHGLVWEIGRSSNALVAVLDPNGGSLAQPWLHPWLEGETVRPAIDWAAADLDEALEMSRVLVQMAIDRKTSYRHLKVEQNVSLLPLSAGLPSYQLIVDEGGEVMSTTSRDPMRNEIRDNVEEIVRIGRDAGFNAIVCALRAVQDMVSPDVVKQSKVKIGMYADDEAELAYLFGWHKGADPDELAGPGTGFYRVPGSAVRPFKAGNLLHGDIARAAVTIANNRPDLDAAGIAVGGSVYRDRLQRMQAAFGGNKAGVALPTEKLRTPPAAEKSAVPVPAPTAGAHLTMLQGGASSWPDPSEIATAAGAGFAGRYDLAPERVEAIHAEQVTAIEARPVPELLTRALSMPWDDGRLHSAVLAGHLGMTEHDLARLLGALGVTALRNAFLRGGNRGRGYERADLEDAAEAVRRGELDVPPEVADWPAA